MNAIFRPVVSTMVAPKLLWMKRLDASGAPPLVLATPYVRTQPIRFSCRMGDAIEPAAAARSGVLLSVRFAIIERCSRRLFQRILFHFWACPDPLEHDIRSNIFPLVTLTGSSCTRPEAACTHHTLAGSSSH